MSLYAATLFASAFLLFLVQPVIAKQILSWFGGSLDDLPCLLSKCRESLDRPELMSVATPVIRRPDWRIWSDDFNNLVQVLK
ncbi:MAG: hypothetical protein ABI724_08100 [Betaproteobacteria bacterium]